jgi:signal transduction histidine kinase
VVSQKVFSDEKSNYEQSVFPQFLYEKKISEIIHLYNTKNLAHTASKKTKAIVRQKAFHNNSFSIFDDSSNSILTFIKVNNPVSNKVVGMLVLRSNADFIESKQNSFFLLFSLITLLLFIITIFLYKTVNQKQLLDIEINKKTKELNDKNRELEDHEFELELVNENLENRIKEEVSRSRDKDKLISEQSKMVAMGEMIGNIAHHWRQPLSAITTSVTGMMVQKECGILSDEIFTKNCENINDNAQYLSKTIDDFRNLLRGDSKKETFNLKELFTTFLTLHSKTINEEKVTLEMNIQEDIVINSLPNELSQCLTNMFLNAKDAMKNMQSKKYLLINVSKDNSNVIITFHDNGGGIEENILDKIFEPYFTTKHQALGTGLGLHIVYRSIIDSMHGTISVENEKFIFNNQESFGAKFTITLPITE